MTSDGRVAALEEFLATRGDLCLALFDWPIDLTEGCRIMAGYFRSFFDRYRLKGAAIQAR